MSRSSSLPFKRSLFGAALLAASLPLSLPVSAAALNLPDFTPLVEEVTPAVVSISVEMKAGGRMRGAGSGSGFVLSADGYIVTNHHVVDGATRIRVKLRDGREMDAKKIGSDEGTDVALLKIEAKDLKPAKIGNPDKLKPGAWVLAFGAPLGLDFSVSAGIVSAKGRSLPGSNYVPFVQSDTAVNRGNSGGPLVNTAGEVVAINSQIMSNTGGSIGLSFSIPVDVAMDVIQQIKANGRVSRGYLGLSLGPVDPDSFESWGLDRPRGALVNEVIKGQAADKAGLKVGDIIVAVDGQSIEESGELPPIIGRTRPGKSVVLDVLRAGKTQKITVKVGEAPDSGDAGSANADESGVNPRQLGMSLRPATKEERSEADISGGLLIARVEEGPAQDAGLKQGDIIVAVGQHPVATVDDLRTALKRFSPGKSAPLLVARGGSTRFVPVRIPE